MYWCECRMLILFMKCNPKHKIHLETLCFSYSEIKGSRPTFVPEKFVIFIFLFNCAGHYKLRALRWVAGKKKDLVDRAQGKVWKNITSCFLHLLRGKRKWFMPMISGKWGCENPFHYRIRKTRVHFSKQWYTAFYLIYKGTLVILF